MIYGCMGLGGIATPISEQEISKAFHALDTAYQAGFRRFDHADIYNGGRAETVFGLWLQHHPSIRNKIRIQSKTGIKLNAGPLKSSLYDLSKTYILKQVNNMLERLRTDYLDMLLLHRFDPLTHGDELKEVFHDLKSNGRVKSFGVSNMSAKQTEWISNATHESIDANQLQLSLGHSLLLDEQVLFNIMDIRHTNATGMLQFAIDNDIEIQAWSPLDRGRFLNLHIDSSASEYDTGKMLKRLGEKYGVDAATIALNWIMQIPGKVVPVIGSTNPQRIKSMALAEQFSITHDEWYALWITARDEKLP